MSNITVSCPHCNITLETPDTLLGREVQCPACKRTFVVQQESAPKTNLELMPSPASYAEVPRTADSKLQLITACIGGVALIISIIALGLAVYAKNILPNLKFESDPEQAVRANLTFSKKMQCIGNYFWRKNGDKILKSLEIKEIKVNGNWAVAFYKLSLGATEVKKTMILYKVNDGYWMEISAYDAKKKCPENWYRNMSEKIDRFQKDSGEFDILDM